MREMLYGGGETRRPSRGPTGGRGMALLLVLVVLVCDGALGAALHQPPATDAGAAANGVPLLADGDSIQAVHAGSDANAPSHAAASDLLTHWEDGGSAADTASILGHVGALLSVLSAILLPWLAGTTGRRGTSPPRLPLRRLYPTHAVGLASRPAIPALQVFRL
jgi:hypothetical protein